MIDRFTQKAREAIRLAVETAEELEHGYVGTEHLLLGLIKEGSGVAAAILERYDVTEDKILELMERLISPAVPTRTADQAEYTHREPGQCCRQVMRKPFSLKLLL